MRRTWILAALLTASCVSAGKYDDLKRQHDESTAMLLAREGEIGELKQALDSEKRQLQRTSSELQARIELLEQSLSHADESAGQLQRALAELAKRKAEADERIAEFRSLLGRFQKLIDAGKLRVKMVAGRMVVELPTDVLFRSGAATLSPSGQEAITEVAQLLAEIPDRSFQVEGHTDSVQISTAQYPSNWELAAARSVRVVKTMIEAGMPPERISASSYGEFRPVQSNETREGRDANRRIEIVVVPDLSSLPGFEELQHLSN